MYYGIERFIVILGFRYDLDNHRLHEYDQHHVQPVLKDTTYARVSGSIVLEVFH